MHYLTKSRFVTGLDCPVKLRYLDDAEYANAKASDAFLSALADGGHQIGALAKCLYQDGIEIDGATHVEQVEQTKKLLTREEVVIYEAAFMAGDLFIRVDILRKQGDSIELLEVKAKSYDSREGESQFVGKQGVKAEFKPYLYDVAFQRHVLSNSLPGKAVKCFLVMPDKARTCSEDGVAQRLRLIRTGPRRVRVDIDPSLHDGRLAWELLTVVPVDAYLDQLVADPLELGGHRRSFEDAITLMTDVLAGSQITPLLGNHCKDCEFRLGSSGVEVGLKDGRLKCWMQATGSKADRFARGTVYDLCGFRRAGALASNGTVALDEVSQADLKYAVGAGAISPSQRQWYQCEEASNEVGGPLLMADEIRAKFNALEYPLHFIDFETATPAIPFHAGRHPFEDVWFQFSLHMADAHGHIAHVTEELASTSAFPSFDTLRRLRDALGDRGSVLHWWTHEATILSHVRDQITAHQPPLADQKELLDFIESLLGTTDRPGRLVDLGRHVAEKWVVLPGTQGRSSIKKVLPAILKSARTLQMKYSEPIYGTEEGIVSLNYSRHVWVQRSNSGEIVDPYKLLGGFFDDPDLDAIDDETDVVADGGQAMVAYGTMLSLQSDEARRDRLRKQLLRYCELDSFAMVLAWEGLRELSSSSIVR